MTFPGFSPDTLRFLASLEEHNDKRWFDCHRQDYEDHWLAPGQAFVSATAPGLWRLDDAVQCIPKINGSIFRLHRDVRFSRDKRPYKEHLDIWFWNGAKKRDAASGFLFRLKKDHVFLAAGNQAFDRVKLARFREQVADPKAGAALVSSLRRIERAGYTVAGAHYKRQPRGTELTGRQAELVRHRGLYAHVTLPVDDEVHGASIVTTCLNHFKKMQL